MRGLPNVTYCTLTHQSSGNWRRHAKQHAFLYQLWTTGASLNILLDPLNHNSQNSPDKTHELGSWVKNEMMCYELEPWVLTPFLCKYELFLALEEIFPKSMIVLTWCGSPMKWTHMVWKNLSSIFSPPSAWVCFARACFAKACTSEDVSLKRLAIAGPIELCSGSASIDIFDTFLINTQL